MSYDFNISLTEHYFQQVWAWPPCACDQDDGSAEHTLTMAIVMESWLTIYEHMKVDYDYANTVLPVADWGGCIEQYLPLLQLVWIT